MPKIRTTFMPWKEISVSDEEYADLERMGRVLKTTATTDAGLLAAAERQNAKSTDEKQEN